MNRNGKEDKDMQIKANRILKKEQRIKVHALSCRIKNWAIIK